MSWPETPTIGQKETIDGKQWEYMGDGVWERTDISLRPDIITFDTADTLTIDDTHIGAYVRIDRLSSATVIIPLNATDPLPVSSIVTIMQVDGQIVVQGETGVTINAFDIKSGDAIGTKGKYAALRIVKVGTDEWDVIGHRALSISLVKYGKLYTWNDLDGLFGVGDIIDGYKIPTDAEWTTLTDYIEAEVLAGRLPATGVGNILKHPRKNGGPVLDAQYNTSTHPMWDSDGPHYGRDSVLFGALPGGYRDTNENYWNIGEYGYWGTSTESSQTSAYDRSMYSFEGGVFPGTSNKAAFGLSFRLVRTATQAEQDLDDGAIVEKVTDNDDNLYDCVKIGTQVWTVQNLATTTDALGNAITNYDYDDDDSNTFFATNGDSIWANLDLV